MVADNAKPAAAGVSQALACLAEHRAGTEALRQRAAEVEKKRRSDQAAFDELADAIAARNLAATLDDKPLPPETEGERRRLQQLRASVDAGAHAAPILKDQIADRVSEERELGRGVTDAWWHLKAAYIDVDVLAIRDGIAALAPLLTRLSAIDEVQHRLVGTEFATSSGVRREVLVSTSRLVDRLINGIPAQMKPDALTPLIFDAEVQVEASKILKMLEN